MIKCLFYFLSFVFGFIFLKFDISILYYRFLYSIFYIVFRIEDINFKVCIENEDNVFCNLVSVFYRYRYNFNFMFGSYFFYV